MRTVTALALCFMFLALLATEAQAARRDVLTDDELPEQLYQNRNNEVCQVSAREGYYTAPRTRQWRDITFNLPANGCGSLLGTDFDTGGAGYSAPDIIDVLGATALDTSLRATLIEYGQKTDPPVGSSSIRIGTYNPSILDRSYGQGADIVLLDMILCGERIRATYEGGGTAIPRDLYIQKDSANSECRSFTRSLEGNNNARQATFMNRQGNNPHKFPLPVTCEEYYLDVYARSNSDWNQMTSRTLSTIGSSANPAGYTYYEEQGSNTLEVTLALDEGRLSRVYIELDDSSDASGGVAFRLICRGVPDPDTDIDLCESPWRWNETVHNHPQNTPPQACCGDDGDDDLNLQVGGFTCTRENNNWRWVPPSAQCINGNCCFGAGNESRVITTEDDMLMCLNGANGWGWRSASTDTSRYTVGTGTTNNFTVVSDGTQWVSCQNTLTNTTRTFTRVTASEGTPAQTPVEPSNRQATPYCGRTCQSCDGDLALQDQCDYEGGTSPACDECAQREAESTCEPDPYYCPSEDLACLGAEYRCGCSNQNLVWDGSACVQPVCPGGYTYSAATALCEPPGSGESGETSPIDLPALGVCNTVVNAATETNDEYICTGTWTAYSEGTVYGLEETPAGSDRYERVSDPRVDADIICTADGYEIPVRVPSQDRLDEGACGTNQCFFSPNNIPSDLENVFLPNNQGNSYISRCVQSGEWVLDHYCDAGNWTTRSQLLADTLVTLLEDDYIVHCDAYNQSLNAPSAVRDFATQAVANEVPRTNGYCSVYDASLPGTPLVAVGTTLNGVNGVSLAQLPNSDVFRNGEDDILFETRDGEITGTLFTDLINDPDLRATQGACDNIKSLSLEERQTNRFYRCNTLDGNVFYNPKTSTIVFTTADVTLDEPARGFIDQRMQALASTVPRPLAGQKIYVAKSGDREVVAVIQAQGPIGQGRSVANIAYNAIDVANHYARRLTANKVWTRNGNLVTMDFGSTTVDEDEQRDWEYFTLQVRP